MMMRPIHGFNSIIRVGEVHSVNGRSVRVLVDNNKNDTHLLYNGTLIKNVSVGSYVKIAKGYVRIIAKVEGEYIGMDKDIPEGYHSAQDVINRYLDIKLLGFIDGKKYSQGIKEMPLIGNECFLLEKEEFDLIHQFSKDIKKSIFIGNLLMDEDQLIHLGVNELFSSHIGIFGNTGSGKSYTLAKLYHQLFEFGRKRKSFLTNSKFLFFDFNGEYSSTGAITIDKKVYKLNSRSYDGDKLPFTNSDFIKPELISILASATEKTQQPFIRRALRSYEKVLAKEDKVSYIKQIIRNLILKTLKLEDSSKGNTLLSYIEQVILLGSPATQDEVYDCRRPIVFNSKFHYYYYDNDNGPVYFNDQAADQNIANTELFQLVDRFDFNCNVISQILVFLYLELSKDLLANRVNNDHIAPAINKLKSHQASFENIFSISNDADFWGDSNIAVVDMNNVSTDLKKLIPLLLSQKMYTEHKMMREEGVHSLNIIIDEAHNILSYESNRESETWKDYRLETFEEIIKEGRKFGVFLTVASQRPSDISPTIISQLHNFFIHRLVNQRDIDMVGNNISYLDKLSVEQLPNLPTGGCVVAGVMTQLPVLVQIQSLADDNAPKSRTIDLIDCWGDIINN